MFASTRSRAPRCAALLLALLSTVVITASAAPITLLVGGDGGTACDFSNIQDALNAAASNTGPDTDTIRIAMNATYSAQALKANTTRLNIVGGYATCASAAPTPGARTVISGLGGAADSVFEVLASAGQGNLRMENLLIRDGDETDDGVGGGIDYKAQGTLTLANVIVAQNRAGYGGGISFNATGGTVFNGLTLESDVVVQNNVAKNSGGGIRIEGPATLFMLGPRTTLVGNEAQGIASDSGYGGGLQILPPASAQIGSQGFGSFGVISGNRAKYGGGIGLSAREGNDLHGYALLYSTDPSKPVRVDNNIASVAGGGIFANAKFGISISETTAFCAYEFRIDHNRAPSGAAIYLDSGSDFIGITLGTLAHLNFADANTLNACGVNALPPAPGAVTCQAGVPCNLIDGNVVAQANGQPAAGAVIEIAEDSSVNATRVAIVGNSATDIIHDQTARFVDLDNCLIADNTLGNGRIMAMSGRASIVSCTIAGNTFGLSDTLSLTNSTLLRDAIIWQPGKIALGSSHGPLDGFGVLTNDPASLPIPGVFNLDPRFVDPGRGDYRLRAASPAIDVAMPETSVLDLDGAARMRELPMNNGFGPMDLGTYERQALLPLVLNANFNTDTAHWFDVTTGVSAFDATENAPGSPAGGSMNFNWENTPVAQGRVVSRAQCIHLPLPGTYKLNGFARTTGGGQVSGQAARLQWELRRNGTEACTTGAVDAQGDLSITGGTAWVRAATPASITITPDQFTRNSSITVSLVMVATGVTFPPGMHGWFDDITLTLDLDPLFSDGFE